MTPQDRKLLELAAHAAGHQVARWTDDNTALLLVGVQAPWNPLTRHQHGDFMADAMRLVVKLGMELQVDGDGVRARVWRTDAFLEERCEPDGDAEAAVGRAVCRAAAIGIAVQSN